VIEPRPPAGNRDTDQTILSALFENIMKRTMKKMRRHGGLVLAAILAFTGCNKPADTSSAAGSP